jgi:hypothetical protein
VTAVMNFLGSIKCWKTTEWLHNLWPLEWYSAPQSLLVSYLVTFLRENFKSFTIIVITLGLSIYRNIFLACPSLEVCSDIEVEELISLITNGSSRVYSNCPERMIKSQAILAVMP